MGNVNEIRRQIEGVTRAVQKVVFERSLPNHQIPTAILIELAEAEDLQASSLNGNARVKWAQAARNLESEGRLNDAGVAYEKAGMTSHAVTFTDAHTERALNLWGQLVAQDERAGWHFRRTGDEIRANNAFFRAARTAQNAKFYDRASHNYELCGDLFYAVTMAEEAGDIERAKMLEARRQGKIEVDISEYKKKTRKNRR